MKKMFIFDLDDTLLNEESQLSSYSKKVLERAREKGNLIVIDTARGLSAALNGCKDLTFDYLIANGGSLIIDNKEKIVYSNMMDINVTNKFLEYLYKTDSKCSLETIYGTYTSSKDRADEYTTYFELGKEFNLASYKTVFEIKNEEEVIKVAESLGLIFTPYYFHKWARVNSIGVSKGLCIIELCKIIGMDIKNTVAFGDDYGDVEMLKTAGDGVAVANSQPAVLEAIKNHCRSNVDDGPTRYMEEIYKI